MKLAQRATLQGRKQIVPNCCHAVDGWNKIIASQAGEDYKGAQRAAGLIGDGVRQATLEALSSRKRTPIGAEAEVELKNDKLRRKLNAKEALIIESACQHKAQVESSKAAIRADALSPRGTIRTVKLSKGEADPRPEGGVGEVYEGAQRANAKALGPQEKGAINTSM